MPEINPSTGKRWCRWQRYAGFDQLSPEDLEKRITYLNWRAFSPGSDTPQLAWLGHGSFLVVWRGQRMLIDPVFSRFIGVIPRRSPLPEDWRELQPDAIFLTHAHMDHFDLKTLSSYHGCRIFLPRGSERFLGRRLKGKGKTLGLGEKVELGEIRIQSVTARHGGWRYPWQRGCQAFGYVLTDGDFTIYVAGDSAYGPHFATIGRSFNVDMALLPIGAYSPRWFLKPRHMNPEEAVLAFHDIGADSMIPYHFGTYRLSMETLSEPLPRFAECARKESCSWRLPVGL